MSYGKHLLCLEYLIIFITAQLTSQTIGHMCYVCGGKEAQLPFIENKSIINDTMNKSCREFENLSIADRKRYEFECPKNFNGCITKITATSVIREIIRTCSEIAVDDCQNLLSPDHNNQIICICRRELCNHEKPQMINNHTIETELGDTIDIDSDDEDETDESGDDFISSTQKATNWQTTFSIDANDATEKFNESMIMPSINKSVSFNLSTILAVICLSTSVHKSLCNS